MGYPLVNYHSNGTSPFSIGNTSSKGPFSILMLVHWSVTRTSGKILLHVFFHASMQSRGQHINMLHVHRRDRSPFRMTRDPKLVTFGGFTFHFQ